MKRLACKATPAVQACGRLLIVGGIIAVGCLYLSFGTLTPCGILREAIRQRDSFAAILPDGLINFALESQYGPLSDDRCFSVLLDQITRVEPPSLRLKSAEWAATDAAAYEGRRLRQGLLDKSNTASGVWADTAYRSAANETFLNKNGFVSHINRKKPKGRAIRIVGPPHRQWSFHQGRAQSPRDFNSRPGIHSG